jgi:hypothetical protein
MSTAPAPATSACKPAARIIHMFPTPRGVGFCRAGEPTDHAAAVRRVSDCYTFDFDNHQFSRSPDMDVPVPRPSPPEPVADVQAKGADLEVCEPSNGRCTTITPRIETVGSTAISPLMNRLLVLPARGAAAELWDLDVMQRLATIGLRTTECRRRARFVRNTILLLEAETCADSAAETGTLFDDRGRPLGTVGGAGFDATGAVDWPVSNTRSAFLADGGLAIHDLSTGAMVGPFDLNGRGRPWRSAWFMELGGERLAALDLAELPGRVAIIDPTSGIIEQFDPPACGP